MVPTALALLALLAADGPPAGREPPAPAGVRMATDGPPPAPMSDPRGAAGPGQAWIEGYWQWTDRRWSWVPGQWATPPAPGATWVPARWASDDRGFTFHEPFWRLPMRPAQVFSPPPVPHTTTRASPPALLVELKGPPPSRDAVFIPGFWSWTGARWAWVGGTWSAPLPGSTWVEGAWKSGAGGFQWKPGRWRKG